MFVRFLISNFSSTTVTKLKISGLTEDLVLGLFVFTPFNPILPSDLV